MRLYDDDYKYPPIANPELNGKKWALDSRLETYPNPDYLGIHTRAPLCEKGFWYSDEYSSDDKKLEQLSVLTTALLKGLQNIPGVTNVQIRPYRVSIQRSPAYTWEEILEKAVPVFVSYCPVN